VVNDNGIYVQGTGAWLYDMAWDIKDYGLTDDRWLFTLQKAAYIGIGAYEVALLW
jgi:hypothetical protein